MTLHMPNACAAQQIDVASLNLQHAISNHRSKYELLHLHVDVSEERTRRHPLSGERHVHCISDKGPFPFASFESAHRCEVEIFEDVREAGVDLCGLSDYSDPAVECGKKGVGRD